MNIFHGGSLDIAAAGGQKNVQVKWEMKTPPEMPQNYYEYVKEKKCK